MSDDDGWKAIKNSLIQQIEILIILNTVFIVSLLFIFSYHLADAPYNLLFFNINYEQLELVYFGNARNKD